MFTSHLIMAMGTSYANETQFYIVSKICIYFEMFYNVSYSKRSHLAKCFYLKQQARETSNAKLCSLHFSVSIGFAHHQQPPPPSWGDFRKVSDGMKTLSNIQEGFDTNGCFTRGPQGPDIYGTINTTASQAKEIRNPFAFCNIESTMLIFLLVYRFSAWPGLSNVQTKGEDWGPNQIYKKLLSLKLLS